MNITKNNAAAMRFNMQDQYQENWDEDQSNVSGHNQGILPHHGG